MERFSRLAHLPPWTAETTSRLGLAALWCALILILFPGFFGGFGTGLDPSWVYAINALPQTGVPPGDAAFTYGPLGWLLHPAALGDHLAWAGFFRLLVHALFAVALARALRGASLARGLAFAALFVLSRSLGLAEEDELVLTLALLLAPELREPRRVPWAAALAGALIVFYGLLRVNVGLSAAVVVGGFGALLILRRRPRRRRAVAAVAAGLAVAATVAVAAIFGSPGQALRWLGLQMELVRGFGAAMQLPAAPEVLAAGLLGLAAFAGLCLYAQRKAGDAADLWTILLLPAGLAFQHGFIRADVHVIAFLPFVLGAVSLGLLVARGEPELRAALAAALVLLPLGLNVAFGYAQPIGQKGIDFVLGIQGWQNLHQAASLASIQRRVERRQRRELKAERLPEEFVAPVRDVGLGVDVLPWELSYLPANDLRWVPNPTLQLYAAYTRPLDRTAARHFAGPGAPDLLLVHSGDLDGRDPLWDTPETWRAILAGYQLDPQRPAPGLLALRRRPRPLAWHLESRGEARAAAASWIDVPAAAGDWTFAAIELEPSWTGRLQGLIFGVPPVYLQVLDADGEGRKVRILPATAQGGLLLAPSPKNLDELAALWNGGGSVGRIARLRLVGPGMSYFRAPVRVRWLVGRAVEAGP
ncbi:MAG TPA: hypothetical protein VGM86_29795 [Thermoanaerobaculia bacterium]|jgi:hypothetical protein